MYSELTPIGAYLVWTVLFVLLGGAVFGSLVVGSWRLSRFYGLFALAFFAYAAGWISAYFTLGGKLGELFGSFAGSILLAFVLAVGFGASRSVLTLFAILFLANSLGYFLGSAVNDYIGGSRGMLMWGVLYGLGLGAGLGAVLHLAQVHAKSSRLLRNRKD
jgi:hypothetical protein